MSSRGTYRRHSSLFKIQVGQLTMELDLLKKTPSPRFVSSNESASIISRPPASPSVRGVK